MLSTQSRRSPYISRDGISNHEGVKVSLREDKDLKLEQEYIPNGVVKNGNAVDSYVGYSNIPNQIFRRAVCKGFEFNMMVVGESGLGKSTFINSLFLTDIYNSENPGPSMKESKTVEVRSSSFLLQENGVSLKLNIVDTPGFGDSVDNSECWQPIMDFIDSRFDAYMTAEGKISRNSSSINDSRIHACLYFISPTGHRLRKLDIDCLRRIHEKVNVIPIIGRADCLTPEECKEFKRNIVADLQLNKIRVYDFPDIDINTESNMDEETIKMRRQRDRIPFAVVGANTYTTNSTGAKVRARSYPWGIVEVDNIEHNDFAILRFFLIRLQMQNLREVTHHVLYENYRNVKLSGIAVDSNFQTSEGKDPMMLMEAETKVLRQKLTNMEAEMESKFLQKLEEKNQKLREFEADFLHRADQMRDQLHAEEAQLEADRKAFEVGRSSWEEVWREWDIGADLNSGLGLGLGERVLSEVIKERSKTEKKRKGLF